jgi:hypothetical protein
MAAPDGEVLTLLINEKMMELLVEWNDFGNFSESHGNAMTL